MKVINQEILSIYSCEIFQQVNHILASEAKHFVHTDLPLFSLNDKKRKNTPFPAEN